MEDGFILQAWKGKTTTRTPIWLMRQAGRYLPEYRALRAQAGGFLDMVYNPKLACEITLQPLARFDLDAAILFSDILVVPQALGQHLEFREGEGPHLGDLDVAALDDSGVLTHLEPIMETVSAVRARLPKDKALIGFAGSPWTVASYMVEGRGGHDFARIKGMDKGERAALIEMLVHTTITYLDAQIMAGAQAVQLFESWAGVLSGAEFDELVIAPNRAITAALRAAHPDVPLIGFPRTDNADDVARFAREARFDAVALSQGIDVRWAAQTIQPNACVQGNLDPELLLKGGPDMLEKAAEICGALGKGPFVFNLGHGVIKETDPANVQALVEAVHRAKVGA